jgi:hypothetical protein
VPAVPQKPLDASLDFLKADPVPVGAAAAGTAAPAPAATLPSKVVDDLMRLDGVDGVWVEQDPAGKPIVVLHYSATGPAPHLPPRVLGMSVRIVGGEPIRAL